QSPMTNVVPRRRVSRTEQMCRGCARDSLASHYLQVPGAGVAGCSGVDCPLLELDRAPMPSLRRDREPAHGNEEEQSEQGNAGARVSWLGPREGDAGRKPQKRTPGRT